MNIFKYKNTFIYVLHTVIIILFLKIFTELISFLSTKLKLIDSLVLKIGKIDGVYSQASTTWYPQLDNLINLIFLILFFIILVNKKRFNKNLKIDKSS